ncbi:MULTISPECIES: FHA domain-containing protein [Lysobacter]|uniref:FHA domain-containing protein n=1 Tax=Lysobacter TaxID=68 RepID=UPI00068EA127|nr:MULTISPECIES: FHA domain-containing protein [Lysobacter]
MQARLIAYPPDHAAVVRSLRPGDALSIGRAPDCDLVIAHPSISRRHAELRGEADGWRLRDLGSKNGSFADGLAVDELVMTEPYWLRFGDVHCEFAPLSAAEIAAGEQGQSLRRAAATAHTMRLQGLTRLDDLLDGSLRAVLDLAQCERGFVLFEAGDGDGYKVHSSLALDPGRLGAREFSGSVGAVRRALQQRRAVVANDVRSEAWLATRASVVAAGINTLVCLPLLDGEQTLGVLYADRVRPGPAITTLDLELLEAFAEGAAVWIAVRRTSEWLDAQPAAPQWERIVAAQFGEAG